VPFKKLIMEVYELDEIFGLGKKKGTSPRAERV
jgi:hypothetical protein